MSMLPTTVIWHNQVAFNNLCLTQGPHDDPSYRGMYDSSSCPAWGKDWDCKLDSGASQEQIASVYNQACSPCLFSYCLCASLHSHAPIAFRAPS